MFCFPTTPDGAPSTRRHHQPLASTGRARCGCACDGLARSNRCCRWLGGFVRRGLRDAPNMLTTLNVPRVSACSRRAAQLEDIVGAHRRPRARCTTHQCQQRSWCRLPCKSCYDAALQRASTYTVLPYGSSTTRRRLIWLCSASTVLQ